MAAILEHLLTSVAYNGPIKPNLFHKLKESHRARLKLNMFKLNKSSRRQKYYIQDSRDQTTSTYIDQLVVKKEQVMFKDTMCVFCNLSDLDDGERQQLVDLMMPLKAINKRLASLEAQLIDTQCIADKNTSSIAALEKSNEVRKEYDDYVAPLVWQLKTLAPDDKSFEARLSTFWTRHDKTLDYYTATSATSATSAASKNYFARASMSKNELANIKGLAYMYFCHQHHFSDSPPVFVKGEMTKYKNLNVTQVVKKNGCVCDQKSNS